MRAGRVLAVALAASAWPLAAGAQSLESKDWQLVCDNVRSCRAAGYSVAGSEAPVSVLLSRAAGPGMPVYAELQLGTLDPRSVRPGSVVMTIAGKPAGTIRLDRDNHAQLAGPVAAALLRAVTSGNGVTFTAGKGAWRLSADGAAEVLDKFDEVQGRIGRPSALVRKGTSNDADTASPMAVPRFEAGNIGAAHLAGDDALAVRVMASVHSDPDCPLLDDGQAQGRARIWHLDVNRLLVSQACRPASEGGALGYWLANVRPPYDARPMTYSGAEFDGSTVVAHTVSAPSGDCGTKETWTWNGYRFDPSYAGTGGLCRGVKAGGAWDLPTVVSDIVPGR